MYKHLKRYIFSFVVLLGLILNSTCLANVLDDWQDVKAYKPKPILFLHGFAKGNPKDWNTAKSSLSKYFSKYQSIGTYLEAIDFQDPNGSVDTYDSGKTNPQGSSKGWSDKVENKVNELLAFDKYGAYTNKVNLVCHSMGGLAGRWYLANYSDNFIDKLILIGVPNKGSVLAEGVNALSKIPKLGWLTLVPVNSVTSFVRDNIDIITNILNIDIEGEAVDDLDISSGGSGFLNNLNNIQQPSKVDYFGIIGVWGGLPNWVLFKDWYGGDWIVSKDSQLGTDYISLKDSIIIPATHFGETKITAQETDNKILKFLDSNPPEFEITSPNPNQIAEIYESSIHIRGKVYKEYFPADTQLIINVTREEDGQAQPEQSSFLKASDLWIPNNPDSPVAEFDEQVNFPGTGYYKISCQLKNPSGITSDIKDLWVNVTTGVTGVIVHCHNPEGKEIASIQGVSSNSVQIYDGDNLIGYGANNVETHNRPTQLTPGAHTIKAVFNGMTEEQTLTLNSEETKILIFTFERTEVIPVPPAPVSRSISGSGHYIIGDEDIEHLIDGEPPNYIDWHYNPGTTNRFEFTYEVNASYTLSGWALSFQSHMKLNIIDILTGAEFPFIDGEARIRSPCGFSIPSSGVFSYWFLQGSYTNNDTYGYFRILANYSDFIFGDVWRDHSGYAFNSLKADRAFNDIRFSFYNYIAKFEIHNGYEGEIISDKEVVMALSNFKISSVPYDLTGSAI